MSGVTPESTTAALAGEVPKTEEVPEPSKVAETEAESGPAFATISSAAPDSSTAKLAKDVPLEHLQPPPGSFPETPGKEQERFSVKPIPATAGTGNPIHLKPGETVPDPSTVTKNTITSTVTTDKAGYEKDASAPGISPPATAEGIAPVSSTVVISPTIQSAAPTSTTATLAGAVPLEASREGKSAVQETPAQDVPQVVKESIEKSHEVPEAAGSAEAVAQKKGVEGELVKNVKRDESAGEPAPAATAPAPEEAMGNAGAGKSTAPETPTPKQETAAPADKATGPTTPADTTATDKKKRRNRASGFFQKLKQKLK